MKFCSLGRVSLLASDCVELCICHCLGRYGIRCCPTPEVGSCPSPNTTSCSPNLTTVAASAVQTALDLTAWERRAIEWYPVGRKEVTSVEKSRER